MADLMMRMAGRGEDGLAKAIKTDKNGKLDVSTDVEYLMNEIGSWEGREVQGNSYWDSASAENLIFETKNFSDLHLDVQVDKKQRYSLSIVELFIRKNGSIVTGREEKILINNETESKKLRVKIDFAKFKIRVYNNGPEPLKVGIYAYLKDFHDEKYYLDSIEQLTHNEVLLDEWLADHGRLIKTNSYWDSAEHDSKTFNSKDFTHFHIQTFTETALRYSVDIIEVLIREGASSVDGRTTRIIESGRNNLSAIHKIEYAHFKIRVNNEGSEEARIGLYAYMKNIADEPEIIRPDVKAPTLNNLEVLINNIVPQDFHDGVFYASKYNSNEIYSSVDGREWTKHSSIPNNDSVEKIITGDTGRLVVATREGRVFVTDENKSFADTQPVIDSGGRFDKRFGCSKHQNVILLNTYSLHGPDNIHEAFLSTDNGASFKKIFDNNTIKMNPTNDTRYHIHDVEYDPYSGKIYVWRGDFTNQTLFESDDWGHTWTNPIPSNRMDNYTTIIATEKGLTLGADSEGGGVGLIDIDRSTMLAGFTLEDYVRNHFWFSKDSRRWISTRPFIDRDKGIYLLGYTAEYHDGSGYVLYSNDGTDWGLLHKTTTAGSYYGIETCVYGKGIVLFGQRSNLDNTMHQTIVANMNLES